nr:phosphoribosylformylglycinamidine synthase [Moraxellaceae bacterium]
SKEHTDDSLLLCGAEVQKGNAPEERKIQRLFRNANATKLIKKCNDFGAGGVCVAIGELADGVEVNLDLVPVKYQGLSGTELAISESQERMAVIVSAEDSQAFLDYAKEENLLATVVGQVTEKPYLILKWHDKEIVNIKREFLDTNGVAQSIDISVTDSDSPQPFNRKPQGKTLSEQWQNNISELNVASQKGLGEMFDSTVGASTILMPYGGKYQMTPIDVSVAKLPVLDKDTDTVSAIAWGCNPDLLSWSPYHGASFAVADSLAKLVCAGIDYKKARLSFQEYFQKLGTDSVAWSKPFLALLGAIKAQNDFQVGAIGGKDSMSGTFNDLTVPPTFISFAVATGNVKQVISPEFKRADNFVYLIDNPLDNNGDYNAETLKNNFDCVLQHIYSNTIVSAMTIKYGGIAEALCKMSFGNRIGVELSADDIDYFAIKPASIIVESTQEIKHSNAILLGKTTDNFNIVITNETIDLSQLQHQWLEKLAPVFPYQTDNEQTTTVETLHTVKTGHALSLPKKINIAKPRILIPAFVGTNSEYDMYNTFNRNGGKAKILPFRNIEPDYIHQSIQAIADELKQTQIFVLAGGFSAGDEPDGSGKFIASILQNPMIKDSINEFLARDGLILGICNGFQALVKSGLLPNGNIGQITPQSPTLTFNKIGRHISQMVDTKIVNNHSPWLSSFGVGQTFTIPVSHGEGRFYADKDTVQMLIDNGQIATQYVDFSGNASDEFIHNPNGSSLAIEGITSADGRIFGKMGHSERYAQGTFKNIEGDKDQNIFANGIRYFG